MAALRTLPDTKLSRYFSRYEMIEAKLPVVSDNRGNIIADAKAMNWKNIAEYNEARYVALCLRMDEVRISINKQFRSDVNTSRDIGLLVTSAFRCREWELYRRRSGTSQHCVGAAVDVQPTNCSPELSVKIIAWLKDKYWPTTSGWKGGFAIKEPTMGRSGEISSVGFAHFDGRATNARWTYPK